MTPLQFDLGHQLRLVPTFLPADSSRCWLMIWCKCRAGKLGLAEAVLAETSDSSLTQDALFTLASVQSHTNPATCARLRVSGSEKKKNSLEVFLSVMELKIV